MRGSNKKLDESAAPALQLPAPSEVWCAVSGVGPPPVAAAPVSDDEEGMEEPPEVREFMQEIGEGRAAAAAAAATAASSSGSGGLPSGPLGLLVYAAVGTVSLGARYIEWTCNSADWLLSSIHPGEDKPPLATGKSLVGPGDCAP